MNTIEVTMTQLRQGLGELVNRAAYGGERVILVSHGAPRAAIIGIEDLAPTRPTCEPSNVTHRSLGYVQAERYSRSPWQPQRISSASGFSHWQDRARYRASRRQPSYSVSYARNVTMKSLVCADAGHRDHATGARAVDSDLGSTRSGRIGKLSQADRHRAYPLGIRGDLGFAQASYIRADCRRKLEQRTLTTAVLRLPVELTSPSWAAPTCVGCSHAASTVQPPMTPTTWRWPKWSAVRSGRVTSGCSTRFTHSYPGYIGWVIIEHLKCCTRGRLIIGLADDRLLHEGLSL